MMHEGALPLWQQIILDLIAPPVITGLWLLLSRGWSGVLGTTDNKVVRSWRKPAALAILVACYLVMFGITLIAYLF
jgi:ABC-type molybdate transport system permease subunit